MNPFFWIVEAFVRKDREQDVARHQGIDSLRSNFVTSTIDAPAGARERLLPLLQQWVRSNLSGDATATFDNAATEVRVLTNGHHGAVGPVDVSVAGRRAVRSWFIADATHTGEIVFAEIIDADPHDDTDS